MSIYFDEKRKVFKLNTRNTSYVFCISELGVLEHLYYGEKISDIDLKCISNRQIYSFAVVHETCGRSFALSTVLQEYGGYNNGDFRIPAVIIENADGTKGGRPTYKTHRIVRGRIAVDGLPSSRDGEDVETLEVVIADEEKQIEIALYYAVYPDHDVIARWQRITNKANGSAFIEKAGSLCLDCYDSDYDLLQLNGMYLYECAELQRVALHKGLQGNGSLTGTTSHHANPFFALCEKNATENTGDVYGFNLLYSGNFQNEIEVDRLSNMRIISGINVTGLRWELKNGESFVTPEAVMTYSPNGIGGMSRNFHNHIRDNIIERRFSYAKHPLVFNTWETAHFEIDEESVLAMADDALKIGADTLVVDDGWFRPNDTCGLGDWHTDTKRFPSGLKGLSEKIHAKGLKFGIWIEPEMVTKESAFFKSGGGRILASCDKPMFYRNQYVIDLTDEENLNYVYNRITDEFKDVEIDYIKWDCNRYLSEVASKITPSGEVYHRQVLGAYRLMSMLKAELPNVFFETCAGGGGRFDLGMLYYSPQIWASDNTDPYARVYIQYGMSVAYPTSAISCHFTKGVCTSGRESTKKFRYLVASFGPYGYELDLNNYTAEEKDELNAYSKQYRENERFQLECDLYRLISPESDKFCAYMQVTKDKQQALFTFLHINSTGFYENILVHLAGLDENVVYENTQTGVRLTGKAWMKVGLRIPNLFKEKSGSGFQTLFIACEEWVEQV